MMRMNKWILGVVVVLVLVAIGLIWLTSSLSGATFGGNANAALKQSPYKESGQYFDIVANFPTTTPFSSAANQTAIANMHTWIAGQITQFKKDTGVASLTPQKAQKQGLINGRKYTLNIVYLEGSSAHTYSYIFTVYEDTGGAHGNTFFKTFTFDANTGAQLSLGDVLTGNYLEKLSALSSQMLTQNLGQFVDAKMLKDGTAPDAKNFQDWFFDNSDLVLLFPPYQVAAYAAGPQTVRIPASDLQGYLKQTYP